MWERRRGLSPLPRGGGHCGHTGLGWQTPPSRLPSRAAVPVPLARGPLGAAASVREPLAAGGVSPRALGATLSPWHEGQETCWVQREGHTLSVVLRSSVTRWIRIGLRLVRRLPEFPTFKLSSRTRSFNLKMISSQASTVSHCQRKPSVRLCPMTRLPGNTAPRRHGSPGTRLPDDTAS